MTALEAMLLAFAILLGVTGAAFLFAALASFALDCEDHEAPAYLWVPGVDLLWLISAPFLRWQESRMGRACVYSGLPLVVISLVLFTLR